jgi:hypothetical protein
MRNGLGNVGFTFAGSIIAAALSLVACTNSETVELNGAPLSDYRQEASGVHVGRLATASTFDGVACGPGWAHFYPDWRLRACTLAEPLALERFVLPAASWVIFQEQGSISVAFEHDADCQGHVCRGTGGPAGIQTEFYPSGGVRSFFLRDASLVNGVLCAADLLAPVELYEDGAIRRCKLAETTRIAGTTLQAGTVITIDPAGEIDAD